MSSSFLKGAVTIPATAKHTATVIFLHGLGDTGHGWAQAMKSIANEHIKYICPTAAVMPVTLNQGYQMPSWFDLYALNSDTKEDEDGIKAAAKGVHSIIDEEIQHGISSGRVVLGGFSQGGSLALYSAYTYPKPLAGIIGLSCWLCLHHLLPQENSTLPVLQCHGEWCTVELSRLTIVSREAKKKQPYATNEYVSIDSWVDLNHLPVLGEELNQPTYGDCDNVVPYQWGKMTSDYIKTFNSNTHTFNTYSGLMHSSSAQEMTDVKNFIVKYLPADGSKM